MILINGEEIKPTIFPDGCPQVWNLPVHMLGESYVVTWKYENLTEYWSILQLGKLVKITILIIWYLPFGRQDKIISNQTCFGLHIFIEQLMQGLLGTRIEVIDQHNEKFFPVGIKQSFQPCHYFDTEGFDLIAFPDISAHDKYERMYMYKGFSNRDIHKIIFQKIRNPTTGEITDYVISTDSRLLENREAKKMVVIDDICDGGATFIKCAKILKDLFPAAELHLKTTYGIYSKGKQVLMGAGYDSIECKYELPHFKDLK